MAVLGLRFCVRAFSSCGKWGPLFIAVRGPLTIAASLVAEHRLQTRRLSNCGSRASLPSLRDFLHNLALINVQLKIQGVISRFPEVFYFMQLSHFCWSTLKILVTLASMNSVSSTHVRSSTPHPQTMTWKLSSGSKLRQLLGSAHLIHSLRDDCHVPAYCTMPKKQYFIYTLSI